MSLPSPNAVLTALIDSLSTLAGSSAQPSNTHHEVTPQTHTATTASTFLSRFNSNSAEKAKSLLLTLHFLFPHELLPALDILDRGLVTCLRFPLAIFTEPDTITEFDVNDHDDTLGGSSDQISTIGGSTAPLSGPPTTHPLESPSHQVDKFAEEELYGEVFYVQSSSSSSSSTTVTSISTSHDANSTNTSSNPPRTRSRYDTRPRVHYEVRLDSWNCTCPAFAYSAYVLLTSSTTTTTTQPNQDVREVDGGAVAEQHGYEKQHLENEGESILKVNVVDEKAEGVVGERDAACQETDPPWRVPWRVPWRFGGTATREDVGSPVCKHILAAALGRAAGGLFGDGHHEGGGGVKVRVVGREEVAGWGGGFGDY